MTFFPSAEVIVLAMLMQHEGKVVPKKLIEIRLWGTTDKRAKNAAEVCIHRLRKRLATASANVQVRTIHRIGYFISG